jgi:hypothetical protein
MHTFQVAQLYFLLFYSLNLHDSVTPVTIFRMSRNNKNTLSATEITSNVLLYSCCFSCTTSCKWSQEWPIRVGVKNKEREVIIWPVYVSVRFCFFPTSTFEQLTDFHCIWCERHDVSQGKTPQHSIEYPMVTYNSTDARNFEVGGRVMPFILEPKMMCSNIKLLLR